MARNNKYNNRKTVVDGFKFDSKAEALFYQHLKMLQKAGVVKSFSRQVKYVLQDKFKHPSTGETVRAIKYIPDFLVAYSNGKSEVIDVKGQQTAVFKLKAKLFMAKYQIPLTIVKYDYRKKEFTYDYF